MSPVIGILLDWNMKKASKKFKYDNGLIMKQRVMNLFRAFTITNVLLTLFGIVVLFDTILPLQVSYGQCFLIY